tara:strand:- start:1391 stop:2737 length:1347 start_codon:yes stop_codon:yes gene_type:complete
MRKFTRKFSSFFFLFSLCIIGFSQALTLSRSSKTITIDNLSDYLTDIEILGLTDLSVDVSFGVGPPTTNWDLAIIGGSVNASTYITHGNNLSQEDILFKAVNFCSSADAFNGAFGAPANNIVTNTYQNLGNITWDASSTNPPSNPPFYIVGSQNTDLNLTTASCGATVVNVDGDANSSPQTHNFRIDLQIDLSAFRAGGVINPGIYNFNILFQIFEDGNLVPRATAPFTLEVEILPILQLKTTTLDRIDFDFIEINNYINGITQFDKTILEVSSNVDWDLLAIGTSVRHQTLNTDYFWDDNAAYTSSGTEDIPLTALEIFQTPDNPATSVGISDYNTAFVFPPTQANNNNISVLHGILSFGADAATGTILSRAIAGNLGTTGSPGDAAAPGSYFSNPNLTKNNYRYSITYRLTPGLPAQFQNGKPAMTQDAKSGYYSMQVRYVITEDQ